MRKLLVALVDRSGRPGRAAPIPTAGRRHAKIVLIAGRPSHGPGDHEFNAGCKLLVKCLAEVPGVDPVFVAGGWPKDESVFDGAHASSSSWTAAAATR